MIEEGHNVGARVNFEDNEGTVIAEPPGSVIVSWDDKTQEDTVLPKSYLNLEA